MAITASMVKELREMTGAGMMDCKKALNESNGDMDLSLIHIFTLSGFESEDYLQKVSTYLNHKIEECTSSDGYRKQSAEARSVLLALNIADDYFKAKKQGGALESDIEAKDKEMYDLKHELISVQIKYENAEKALDKLKAENQELQMKIVQLETEMKNHRTK